jgi:hypothetical protein
MPTEMGCRIEPVVLYVPLLDEGTSVFRPTTGEALGDRRYRVLPVPGYSEELKRWEFVPGSIVECYLENHSDGNVLVARKQVL